MKYLAEEKFRCRRGNLKYLESLRKLARDNRNNPTEAEKRLWQIIKKLKYPFLRQKPMGRFIIDFYYSKLLLAIEVDGDYHDKRNNNDIGRDQMLEQMGIKTIRFRNESVVGDIDLVRSEIEKIMLNREKDFDPSFVKEG